MAWRKLETLLLYRRCATASRQAIALSGFPPHLVDCSVQVAGDSGDFVLVPDFITPEEEQSLMCDVGLSFRRLRYQYAHWDQVRRSIYSVAACIVNSLYCAHTESLRIRFLSNYDSYGLLP